MLKDVDLLISVPIKLNTDSTWYAWKQWMQGSHIWQWSLPSRGKMSQLAFKAAMDLWQKQRSTYRQTGNQVDNLLTYRDVKHA